MKRTHKMLPVMGLVLPVLYFGSAGEATAFCIHNWTDTEIVAKQVHGGTSVPFKRYQEYIEPGKKSCCNWDTHDCNTEGGRHAKVKFDVWFEFLTEGVLGEADNHEVSICDNFTIKANGKIVVHGHGDKPVSLLINDYTCKRE